MDEVLGFVLGVGRTSSVGFRRPPRALVVVGVYIPIA
jgi:hypothetical protein